jgi:exodeoxyribonuclease V alpha subunit
VRCLLMGAPGGARHGPERPAGRGCTVSAVTPPAIPGARRPWGAGSPPSDPMDVTRSVVAPPSLAPFVDAGLLTASDVHAALTLCRLGADERDEVLLAIALAVRAPRLGHVCIELATAATSVVPEGDVDVSAGELPWPERTGWLEIVRSSPLVTAPEAMASDAALVIAGPRLYLERYWRYEERVVRELTDRSAREVAGVDDGAIADGLDRLLPRTADGERPDRQRLAAATAVLRHLTVIAGGPGTGKTTTVAAVLALLHEQAAALARRPPRVALAAPTGKAAARLTASLHASAEHLDVGIPVRDALRAAEASTIHRLLGTRPDNRTRFRHDRDDPLPHDVVVVDETSMVSLSLIAKLLDAVRRDSRLVLLGDPQQLASVEAGTVLGDVVGPAGTSLQARPRVRARLAAATREDPADLERIAVTDGSADAPDAVGGDALPDGDLGTRAVSAVADGIVVLQRVRRFAETSGIATLARAIHDGDVAATLDALADGGEDVRFVMHDDPRAADDLVHVRTPVVAAGRMVVEAAHAGDAAAALAAVDEVRVLCAHRRGPAGVADWIPRIERWLVRSGVEIDLARRWYVGRPVIVARNDHRLGVFNGDVGVTICDGDEVTVAFEGAGAPRRIQPGRLEAVDSVHAMTVHRSQGSQFAHVVVVLPDAASPILTRELLYTAVTRARSRVTVVGSRDAVAAAVARPIARASGLRSALWGDASS